MSIIDPDLERMISAEKPKCGDCPFITDLGFCRLYNKHRNYMLKCEWLEVPLHLATEYYKVIKGETTN